MWNSQQVEIAATHTNNRWRVLLTTVEQQVSNTALIDGTTNPAGEPFTESTTYSELSTGDSLALATELCVNHGLRIKN